MFRASETDGRSQAQVKASLRACPDNGEHVCAQLCSGSRGSLGPGDGWLGTGSAKEMQASNLTL